MPRNTNPNLIPECGYDACEECDLLQRADQLRAGQTLSTPAPAPEERDLGRNPTFGFELEYGNNVSSLATELARLGVTGCDTIHGWHCDCGICSDDSYDFKVQSDSTADGEVISRVFTDIDAGVAAMRLLQDAAIEVDAEPNLSTGLHVHVARPSNQNKRVRGLLAFAAWEDAITALAQGRFPQIRSMNSRVRDELTNNLVARSEIDYFSTRSTARQFDEYLDARIVECKTEPRPALANQLYRGHLDADRHSNLNINTRFSTWEFRIWNATRSAWRMELATRLAIAWYDASFVDTILLADVERTPEALRDLVAIEWQGDDRLAALIDRQVEYLPHAVDAPREFLVA